MGTIQEELIKATRVSQVHSNNNRWRIVHYSLAEFASVWNLYLLRYEIVDMLMPSSRINEIELKVFVLRRWKGNKLLTDWLEKVLANCKNCQTEAERNQYLFGVREEAWRDYQDMEIVWPVRISGSNNFNWEKSNWVFHNFERKRKKAIQRKLIDSSRFLLGASISFRYFTLKDFLDILEKEIITDI